MPETSNRKLVAILFADIAGYTGLMQQDEGDAKEKLERFRQVLNEQVSLGRGDIVHFYGDGCLAIFDNPVEACRTATAIQQQFAKNPVVPVRIGLHSGTVNVEKEHVYGDAVNLTSRIESLGIPGSILVSKRMRDEIRNQSYFLLVSLGQFSFKNVDEPMQVFALANEGLLVPKRSELQGKIQPPKSSNRTLLVSIIGVLLLAAAWFVWSQRKNDAQLSQEIRESRIAILPFENKTNDPELDMLGDMAADWIVQALMSLDDYKVVSTETVRQHLSTLESSPASFLKRTGAEKIIRGNVYTGGDDLIIQTRIVDAESGEIEFAFPEISGSSADLTALVQELRERMLSYLVVKAENSRSKYPSLRPFEKPPKYEAYKAYQKGQSFYGADYPKAIAAFEKAIEIDPEYFWPYLLILNGYVNQGRLEAADSMLQVIDRRFDHLMPYEQLYFDDAKMTLTGNLVAMYQAGKNIFEKDPKDLRANYNMGLYTTHLNRPREAIEYYQYFDPASVPMKYKSQTWWHCFYAYNLIRLDRLDEAMDILNVIPVEKASKGVFDLKQEIYVRRNQPDSIHQMIAMLEERNYRPDWILLFYLETSKDYALQNDRENQLHWAGLALKKINAQPESASPNPDALAAAYYYGEQFDQAIPIYTELVNTRGPNPSLLGRLAICYARTGDPGEARKITEQLENMEEPRNRARYNYHLGLIYANLDEKEKAMQYLKRAHQQGVGFGHENFHHTFELMPLHGYPPYEEFVAPKDQ